MSVPPHLPGYRMLSALRNAAVRTGVYVGLGLSLIFAAWVVVANRMPLLERFALERNGAAAAAIGLLALIPLLRFYSMPGSLWASGSIAWGILSISYRLLGFFFTGLEQRYGAFQVFMAGAVVYTIVATISWIATVVWRLRGPHPPVSPVSHSSAPPPNHRMT
jgi:hypothetical protein